MADDTAPTTATPTPSDPDAQAGRRMTVAALVVTAIIGLGRLLGGLKGIVVAHFFGRSGVADALYVLYDVVVIRSYANVEQLVRPAYLPVFVRAKAEDEAEAWRLTSILTTTAFLVLSAGVAVAAAFAPEVIRLFWPKMAADPTVLPSAVGLFRVMAPAIVFFSLSIMPELTLHSYKRFTWPAVAEALSRIIVPVAMVALIGTLWRRGDPAGIYAFGIGVLLGGTTRFFAMVPALRGKLGYFRPSVAVTEPKMVETLTLTLPVLAGVAFSTLRGFIESRVATDMGSGTYASFKYARGVVDLPVQVLPLAVSFVVFPYLTEWAGQGARDKMADALVAMTRALAFVFVPVGVGLLVLARPTVDLLYRHGQFRPEDVAPTALALICFAPGMLFYAVEGSINKWFFALKDTVTPNVVGIAAVFVHIAIAMTGAYVLHGGVAVLALAYSVSKSLKVLVLYLLIAPRIGAVEKRPILLYAGKLALACAVMAAVVLATNSALLQVIRQAKLALVGTACVGAVAFVATAAVVRIEEFYLVADHVKAWLARRGRSAPPS